MRLALTLVLFALAVVGPAAAAERIVAIPARFFEPEKLVALVGDTVTWRNDDTATHDVEADDGSFDSGELAGGQFFSFTFDREGSYPYICSIHRFMNGRVDVFALALLGPQRPVTVGEKVSLRGLAPTGTGTVTVERLVARSEAVAVATVPAAPDGSFRLLLEPRRTGRYRAVVGGLRSPSVWVPVGVRVALSLRRAGAKVVVGARTSPSQRGARIVLERYVRELFTWVPIADARLDRRSRASFTITPRRRLHIRAILPRGARGYSEAASKAIVIQPG